MVGVAAAALLAASGGTAAALAERADDPPAGHAQLSSRNAPAKADKDNNGRGNKPSHPPGQRKKKPRPTPTPTPTASPSPTAAPSPTPTPTSPPGDGSDVKIPMAGFGDMLVDTARERVYISGGKGTRGIVVTDLYGEILRTLDVASGGAGMTLSPDGTKLYVTASDSDGIVIVDTATYEIGWHWTGTSDGRDTCPRDVAFAAGQLWFSWGCPNDSAGVGRVDPETGEFDLHVAETDTRITSPPLLATVPSQPNTVIAGVTGTSPANLFRFEATSTELQQREWRRTDGGAVRQLAVTPDGSQVIVPSGAPYYHPVLRTSDLVEVHQYPTNAYPNAVAIRPDGLVAAGINGAYDDDVYVFEPDGDTPIATFEFGHLPDKPSWAHTLVDGGLAWHGDRIYAITEQSSEPDVVTLRIRTVE